jgi:hypothetical protein
MATTPDNRPFGKRWSLECAAFPEPSVKADQCDSTFLNKQLIGVKSTRALLWYVGFSLTQEVFVSSIAQEYSLFEIDRELDTLLDEIEEEIQVRGEASTELLERFQQFCEAHGEKADRIGRFVRRMEARVQYCRTEANRLQERARSSERKAAQTKHMVMYYLKARDLKKIEGREFTLRIQKNSQDSVRFIDETQVPLGYRIIAARLDGGLWERLIESVPEDLKRMLVASIQEAVPSNEAIKNAVQNEIAVPGAEVYRGDHLRVV